MATTAHLGLSLVEQAQAQKEITVNTALARIDALLNTGALDKDVNTPPGSPSAGDVYIVGPSPTGAWAGHAGEVAYYDQLWRFIVPNEGLCLWVSDEHLLYTYHGSAWVKTAGGTRRSLYIPAARMLPASSGGCAALAVASSGVNMPDMHTLDFDAASEEAAQWSLRMPKSWDGGTVTMVMEWSHAMASGSYGVVWGVQALAVEDGEAVGASFGTAQEVTDTGGSANTLYKSPETAPITCAGSIGSMDTLYFRLYRKAASGSDTLAVDARLHGVALFYTATAPSED